jgi:hypothetical protein
VPGCFRADSSRGGVAFVEDQAVHVVGDVGQRQFRLGARKADGADEEAEAGLLMREDVLDGGSNGRLLRDGLRCRSRHRLAGRLAPVDATGEHPFRQPFLVGLRTVDAVRPNFEPVF